MSILLTVFWTWWPAFAPQQSGPTDADLSQGKGLFLGQCSPCHGPDGKGGTGPDIAQPRLPRAPDMDSLFQVIRRGIRGTEMTGAQMIEREVWQVARYVRSLGAKSEQAKATPGDAGKGKEIYRGKLCSSCHMIEGQGGSLGPVLDRIGLRRSSAHLRESLIEPSKSIPGQFQFVRLETLEGRKVKGLRLNEDTFSVQVRSLSGEMLSFWKNELQSLTKERDESAMPSYRDVLGEDDLEDLVAYLSALRGNS